MRKNKEHETRYVPVVLSGANDTFLLEGAAPSF
uniref:Uncharacterized protein n=1 Tax=Arundo donax TaxID=35708 RepID=A0A0A9CWN1_ARUDO